MEKCTEYLETKNSKWKSIRVMKIKIIRESRGWWFRKRVKGKKKEEWILVVLKWPTDDPYILHELCFTLRIKGWVRRLENFEHKRHLVRLQVKHVQTSWPYLTILTFQLPHRTGLVKINKNFIIKEWIVYHTSWL